jgi:uncharacterized protein YdcH (DUF465 family)
MSHVHHQLHDEFPQAAAGLHQLKLESPRFNAVAERYDSLNRDINRIEAGLEAGSDERVEALKKQRLVLLDQVSAMLAEVQHG